MADDLLIGALAPWFGGKRNMARRIVAELGPHRAYWGLCCGSMPELFAKEPVTMETVVDLHGDLINLARCVADRTIGPRLYRRLRRVLMSDAEFEEARRGIGLGKYTEDRLDEDRAFGFFVVSWMGRNGMSGTAATNTTFSRRFTKNGGHAAKRFASAVDSIPAWRRRMRNLTILRDDIFEIGERIEDAEGVAIYCDPPYVHKGARYVHDFAGPDHARLATMLGRFRDTRVVVSYYDCDEVRDLYSGWTIVDCATTKALVSAGRRDARGAVSAPEVLIINGPSNTSGGLWA